jgi:hypothetical protein
MTLRWLLLLPFLLWAGCESGGGKSFTGSYSGEGVSLEIKGEGPQHQGELSVGGKTYPVEATASGSKLKGHFKSGDESFELVATLSGTTLELVSGGKTHRLTKAESKNPLAGSGTQTKNPLAGDGDEPGATGDDAPGEPMTGFAGNYSGNIQGTATTLRLEEKTGALSGLIDSGGYIYNLSGKVTGSSAEGTITDPQAGGARMSFKARIEGDELTFSMEVPGAPAVDISFRRGGSGPSAEAASNTGSAAKDNASRDPSLVGTWSMTTSMSSGDVGFASKEYLRITADGRFQLGSGKAVAGGGGWSMGSGDGVEITAQGQWKTQGSQVHINEGGGWQAFARYYVEGNKLMFTFGDGSRQIWYR